MIALLDRKQLKSLADRLQYTAQESFTKLIQGLELSEDESVSIRWLESLIQYLHDGSQSCSDVGISGSLTSELKSAYNQRKNVMGIDQVLTGKMHDVLLRRKSELSSEKLKLYQIFLMDLSDYVLGMSERCIDD